MAGLLGGLLGNFSEVSIEELQRQYGMYLMENEQIRTGFKLVRDSFNINSPYYKANNASHASYKFEFGKKFNLQPIYVALITIASQNRKKLNS